MVGHHRPGSTTRRRLTRARHAVHGGHAVNLVWRKASRSSAQGGDCVELASLTASVAVRDSKDPEGPKLMLGRDTFRALLADLKRS
ncbi:DUF397 domain-containing protein [Actinomadura montaniterrae]|uniref:DUF397 domain-containing protein n=1 Tax=Actinomadura montaniterrae TaxID=1803903 RepID=A0A6L3VPA2_9ACTN|nr:DUF397 domain-containing protein [Actinomadura montaniterrae]KAB2376980.1 DUF397 domain-containing protein [Actinomadura montaniterrae]